MTPTHCSFSVSGNSLEYLIGISPEIMAYGYHRGYAYPELGLLYYEGAVGRA